MSIKIIKDGRLSAIGESVVTLGNFDGLHLGHAKILKRLRARSLALGLPSVVYTFDPHPLKVIRPEQSPALITTSDEKAACIEAFGIDYLVLAEFTQEFASKHPRDFVKESIVEGLQAREVWVGHDYAFGKGKRGTVEYLKEFGKEFGFHVVVVPAYKKGGAVVSSSRLRTLIGDGKVGEATSLLGRYFTLSGPVVHGKNLGKEIGFHTANIEVENELLPADGVYAVFVEFRGRRYQGVANIGFAPTFGPSERTIEAHILDFTGDLYREELKLHLVRRLRGEHKFKNKEALAKRIGLDIERARRILKR